MYGFNLHQAHYSGDPLPEVCGPICAPTEQNCCWAGVRVDHTPGLTSGVCIWCGWQAAA